jgi:hypothetical protein
MWLPGWSYNSATVLMLHYPLLDYNIANDVYIYA